MPSIFDSGGFIGVTKGYNINGMWNLNANYKFKVTKGVIFASKYVANTGGNIVRWSESDGTSGSAVAAQIASMSSGDCLLLEPGAYDCNTIVNTNVASSIWGGANNHPQIAIVGNTDDANDIILTVDNDTPTTRRDHAMFSSGGGGNNENAQLAYLTYKRLRTSTVSYSNALVIGTSGSTPILASATAIIFDCNGGECSWIYDNSNLLNDVKYTNCSFVNIPNWDARFSGRMDVITVENCLFEAASFREGNMVSVNNAGSVPFDTSRAYSISTYAGQGHLQYVP